jgi:hypothetical protein
MRRAIGSICGVEGKKSRRIVQLKGSAKSFVAPVTQLLYHSGFEPVFFLKALHITATAG